MIISHEHQFVFVRTRKTASTAMQIALGSVAGDDAVVTPINDERDAAHLDGYKPRNHERVPLRPHMPAREIAEILGDLWSHYFKFAVERNPWDKAVSVYYYATARSARRPPFAEWVMSVPPERFCNFHRYAIDGKVVVDRVLRYEQLDVEWAQVCVDIGVTALPLPRVKGGYRPPGDYRIMYGVEQAEHVRQVCAAEIDLLGYEF